MRSEPSGGTVASRSNGRVTKFSIPRKKTAIAASTISAHGVISGLRRRFCQIAIEVKIESSHVQNRSDPCCPPHSAANLYGRGSVTLEYEATYSSEKSLVKRPVHSAATATVTIAHIAQSAWRALSSSSGELQRMPSRLAAIE